MRTRWFVGLTGAALGLFGLQASAHHGWAGQGQDQFELTGKLHTDVSLLGPHGSMQIVDDKGQVWDITLAPAARTERAGLKPGVIPKGAIAISESGLKTPADLQSMTALGYGAFLMGERFMVAPDPGAALAGLNESLETATR